MNVLELAEEIGLLPKKAASTNGGEFKSACPNCKDGKDRFCIWPNQGAYGRYWCRVCNCRGDGIQFCRDFLGMSFHQACQKMNAIEKKFKNNTIYRPFKNENFISKTTKQVNVRWQQAAHVFIDDCHQNLMSSIEALDLLIKRGLSIETICKFSLGWNDYDSFEKRDKWGLANICNENGNIKKQWLPKGIVIPTFQDEKLIKIKIRRSEWHLEDKFPKYIEVSGSMPSFSVYGNISMPIIIVESELDAFLIQQYASDLVCSIALGGVSKKPDYNLHMKLKQSPLILLSLDYDDPGKKRYAFWMRNYTNLKPWPSPNAKSLGDAVQLFKINITEWIKCGLFA